ncbi:MAG TPA: hypothetical protein VE959_29435 [Bryobacteraceae bacterium]|nr:hypothetical protein [Bryobacteraceae bacterium]
MTAPSELLKLELEVRMKRVLILGLAVAILALVALPAGAQPVISAKSGTISWVDGKVYLGNELVEPSLTKFPDIKENAVLRTTEEGRAEVLLTPGVVMHVGENSSFRMLTKRLIDTRLELLTGSLVVSAVEIAKDTNVTIVCKDGTVVLSKAGHFRFDAEPARIKVFAGVVDVQIGDRHQEVAAGKMLGLDGATASVEKFDKTETDSLDNWARRRDELMAMANVSAAHSMSYLSSGSGGYGGYGGGYGVWGWNPYFGLYTFIPGSGRFCDPYYGYCYWSPYTVGRMYYNPGAYYNNNNNLGGGGRSNASYPTMGATSGGYSGTVNAASSPSFSSSAPAASASSGSSAASAASSGSAGHGSAAGGGGGHGK